LPIERHNKPQECLIVFKKVAVNAPNTHWQMDITYITLFPRIIFVLGIVDTYTLEIVGYKAGFSITGHDVVKTVLKSMLTRNIQGNLTIRTDNGPQFKSKEFHDFCKRQGILHERIPVRSPERNPNIERFFRTLKEEYIMLNEFAGYGSFIKGLDKFIMEYNTIRPHQSLGYMTPSKFYEEILRNNVSRGVLVV
jgi:Integrase core domain.